MRIGQSLTEDKINILKRVGYTKKLPEKVGREKDVYVRIGS